MSEDGKSILEILNNSDALKCRVSICATMYIYLQTLSDVQTEHPEDRIEEVGSEEYKFTLVAASRLLSCRNIYRMT